MTIRVRARYAEGVLRPLEPLDLKEGCVVTVSVSDDEQAAADEQALLVGWLKDIDWQHRTARLLDARGGHVSLRFDPLRAEEMRRLSGRYVEVRGSGQFNEQDEWTTVQVEELRETQAWSEPFDLDAFLDEPEPKIFDPDEIVRIDLTEEELEAFNRAVREGREA